MPHEGKNEVSCLSKALAICWQIWNDRNASIYRNEKPIQYRSVIRALSTAKDYFKENANLDKNYEASIKDILIKWQCPPPLYVKINFDGFVSNSTAAGGFMVRNWDSKPILAGAMNFGSVNINISEALALCEALIWAKRRGWRHILVEGDSKLVNDVICGACDVPWNLKPIIVDIRWCAKSFQDVR